MRGEQRNEEDGKHARRREREEVKQDVKRNQEGGKGREGREDTGSEGACF